MTPGETADRALTLIYRCGGELGHMLIKKKLTRSGVLKIIENLELALENLRRVAGVDRGG